MNNETGFILSYILFYTCYQVPVANDKIIIDSYTYFANYIFVQVNLHYFFYTIATQ